MAELSVGSPSAAHASVTKDRRPRPISCTTCRLRKVRCDRLEPCSECALRKIPCVLPNRVPRKKRYKTPADGAAKHVETSTRSGSCPDLNEELMNRLQMLEELVGKQLADRTQAAQQSPETMVIPQHDHWGLRHDELENAAGRRDRYIGGTFWTKLNDELKNLRQDTEGVTDSGSESSIIIRGGEELAPANLTNTTPQSFILPSGLGDPELTEFHPTSSQIQFLWRNYKEHLDPITKVVHIPSIEKTLGQVPDDLPPAMQALTRAIYFASLVAMDSTQVKANFGVDKSSLVPHYKALVEQALVTANFLTEPDITICQAFLLFLIHSRQSNASRLSCALTPILVGFSQVLGLHRDGSHHAALTPFEVEMRRRIFWTICVLDLRAAEDQGTDLLISEHRHDTHIPKSFNDDDLDLSTRRMPEPRTGHTDTNLCVIRCKAAQIVRRVYAARTACAYASQTKSAPTVPAYDGRDAVSQLRSEVMSVYPSVSLGTPADSITAIAHFVIAKTTLTVHEQFLFPGASSDKLPNKTQDLLCTAATTILEAVHASKTDRAAQHWRSWLEITPHWHAIAYVLLRAMYQPWDAATERAWTALNLAFGDQEASLLRGNDGAWAALKRLHARAFKRRERAIKQIGATRDQPNAPVVLASDANTVETMWETLPDLRYEFFVHDQQDYQWNDFLIETASDDAATEPVSHFAIVPATDALEMGSTGFTDWDDLGLDGVEVDWAALLQNSIYTTSGAWTMGI